MLHSCEEINRLADNLRFSMTELKYRYNRIATFAGVRVGKVSNIRNSTWEEFPMINLVGRLVGLQFIFNQIRTLGYWRRCVKKTSAWRKH